MLDGGDLQAARTCLEDAIELSGPLADPELLIDIAEIDQWQGNPAAAIGRLERIGPTVADQPAVRAHLELRLLYLERWHGDVEKAVAHGLAAMAAAEETGDLAAQVGARAAFAEAASNVDVATATAMYEETIELAATLTDAELVRALDTFYSLGWAAIHLERYGDAVRHFDRGLTLARRAGSVRHLNIMRSSPAEALIRAGRADEAIACAEEAVEAARLHPSPWYLWWALWIESAALVRAGETERAAKSFAEVEQAAAAMPPAAPAGDLRRLPASRSALPAGRARSSGRRAEGRLWGRPRRTPRG